MIGFLRRRWSFRKVKTSLPFNLTRRTFVKASPDLKQLAKLTCLPTLWRTALWTSLSVKFVTHFINSTNR